MLTRAAPVRYLSAVIPIDVLLGAIPGFPGAATNRADVRNALLAHGRLQVVGRRAQAPRAAGDASGLARLESRNRLREKANE